MIVGEGEEERASGVKLNPMHQQVEPAEPQTQAMSHSLSLSLSRLVYIPPNRPRHIFLCALFVSKSSEHHTTPSSRRQLPQSEIGEIGLCSADSMNFLFFRRCRAGAVVNRESFVPAATWIAQPRKRKHANQNTSTIHRHFKRRRISSPFRLFAAMSAAKE